MKFKRSFLPGILLLIWIAFNAGTISFTEKITTFQRLSNLNFTLSSVVGFTLYTFVYIFYSCTGNIQPKAYLIIRMRRKNYFLLCLWQKTKSSLYFSLIYVLINFIGSFIFAEKVLVISSLYIMFSLMQFIGLFIYLIFLSSSFILIWILTNFKKISSYLTAVFAVIPIVYRNTLISPGAAILSSEYIAKPYSLKELIYSILICLSLTVALWCITVCVFDKKDILQDKDYEK